MQTRLQPDVESQLGSGTAVRQRAWVATVSMIKSGKAPRDEAPWSSQAHVIWLSDNHDPTVVDLLTKMWTAVGGTLAIHTVTTPAQFTSVIESNRLQLGPGRLRILTSRRGFDPFPLPENGGSVSNIVEWVWQILGRDQRIHFYTSREGIQPCQAFIASLKAPTGYITASDLNDWVTYVCRPMPTGCGGYQFHSTLIEAICQLTPPSNLPASAFKDSPDHAALSWIYSIVRNDLPRLATERGFHDYGSISQFVPTEVASAGTSVRLHWIDCVLYRFFVERYMHHAGVDTPGPDTAKVLNKIEELLRAQFSAQLQQPSSQGHLPQLPLRAWKHVSKAPVDAHDSFTLATYNVLADVYAYPGYARWLDRQQLLLKEMQQLRPDVLCMQELGVDAHESFRVLMSNEGYDSVYKADPQLEGCAIYWRRNKFRAIRSHVTDGNTVARKLSPDIGNREQHVLVRSLEQYLHHNIFAMVLLQDIASQRQLAVATSHLPCEGTEIQTTQMMGLLTEVGRFLNTETKKPFIVCGDFNALPSASVLHSFLTSGHLPERWDKFSSKLLPLISAYGLTGKEPAFTFAAQGDTPRTLDYIYHSAASLAAVEVLDTFIDHKEIANGLPAPRYPSDHICLCARFAPTANAS